MAEYIRIVGIDDALQVDFGLTKRELFALAAMCAILSRPPASERPKGNLVPETALKYADDLIKELEK